MGREMLGVRVLCGFEAPFVCGEDGRKDLLVLRDKWGHPKDEWSIEEPCGQPHIEQERKG